MLCLLGQGCGEPKAPAAQATDPLVPAPAPAAAVEPKRSKIPEPPPLPTDAASRCVVRRFHPEESLWRVESIPYDEAKRILGEAEPRQFDAEGRMTTFGQLDSDQLVTLTYDEHGNLRERAATPRGVLRDGTRWENTYEGSPPRLMAQAKGTFTKPSGPTDVSTRTRFRYDDAGHVAEEKTDEPQRDWSRSFTWQGERIVEVQWVVEPRHTDAKLPFDGRETFEYDAQGRLVAHVIDGDPLGEGDLADGKPDQRETFHYDAQGLLARIERDGQAGDVGPEAPDETIDAVTLLSPRCDAPSRLAPSQFGVPELFLPASITPRLR